LSHLLNPAMVGVGVFAGLAWLAGGQWWAGLTGMFFYGWLPALALLYLYCNGSISHVYLPEPRSAGPPAAVGGRLLFPGVRGPVAGAGSGPDAWGRVRYCGNALVVWQINRPLEDQHPRGGP